MYKMYPVTSSVQINKKGANNGRAGQVFANTSTDPNLEPDTVSVLLDGDETPTVFAMADIRAL